MEQAYGDIGDGRLVLGVSDFAVVDDHGIAASAALMGGPAIGTGELRLHVAEEELYHAIINMVSRVTFAVTMQT